MPNQHKKIKMENNTVDSQAEETTPSPADTTQTEQNDNQEAETISLEEARKLRSENKTLRSRAKTAEEKLSSIDAEKLTETQKLQRQVDELSEHSGKRDSSLKSLLLSNAIAELKESTGIRSTRIVTKLIDERSLEFDLDNLKVSGVDAEIKRLKKEDPDLFITGGTDGGAGGSTRSTAGPNMNDLIRAAAGR